MELKIGIQKCENKKQGIKFGKKFEHKSKLKAKTG